MHTEPIQFSVVIDDAMKRSRKKGKEIRKWINDRRRQEINKRK